MSQELPHQYTVTAVGAMDGEIALNATGLSVLRSAAPREFDGPGDRWSPETLLVAAVSDCFVLTFRAVARASRLEWSSLECRVVGTLDRVDKTMRFTRFDVQVRLIVTNAHDRDRALRALEKAERGCLVSNSLVGEVKLVADVEVLPNTATPPAA